MFKKLKEKFIEKLVLVALDLNKNKNECEYIRLYNKRDFIYKV